MAKNVNKKTVADGADVPPVVPAKKLVNDSVPPEDLPLEPIKVPEPPVSEILKIIDELQGIANRLSDLKKEGSYVISDKAIIHVIDAKVALDETQLF